MRVTGWFYGFKLHLVCNEKGELLSFYLTKGNVDDRNPKHIKKMTEQLFGKLFADKGYLSKALWEMLFADGIQLFTKLRKNMKDHIMKMEDKILLRKRDIIETINDELKKFVNICLGFTGETMNDELAKEYKQLGKTLNKVDYGELLPNFVLDAFATAEDGEAVQVEIPYVESATEEWQSLKQLAEMMIEGEAGKVKEEWESLRDLANMMLSN